ncbi:MAG: L-histidine N(alpha)-methyltransferase [Cyclobacteriaceae bacterium]
MIQTNTYSAEVLKAVDIGLSRSPKRLPSWLFYDEIGDKIFQAIMRMPEYYLTGCEFEILRTKKEHILQYVASQDKAFQLVELGAGDGTKTEILLKHFLTQQKEFTYVPVDISEAVLHQLVSRLGRSLPDLKVRPQNTLYHQALKFLSDRDERKLILFMGANIGNMSIDEARQFVKQIAEHMNPDDLLMVGFDLKKDPRLIQAAYDDAGGITREFNLNLLARINRELGGEFDLDYFNHYPYYDPESGITKSYLVSTVKQQVYIEALDKSVSFEPWEIIHTEVSQKYDMTMVNTLARHAGLEVVDKLYDNKKYFCDVIFRVADY